MITAQARNIAIDPHAAMLPLAMDAAVVRFRKLVADTVAAEAGAAVATPPAAAGRGQRQRLGGGAHSQASSEREALLRPAARRPLASAGVATAARAGAEQRQTGEQQGIGFRLGNGDDDRGTDREPVPVFEDAGWST